MPLIAEDRLLELANANPRMLYNMPMMGFGPARNLATALITAAKNINIDDIRNVLAAIRYELVVTRMQQGKGQRPWDVDPQLYATLDRTQPWWGWEFELGYKSAKAYGIAVGHAYDNFIGATFDSEGEGRYPVEITFPPEEMSAYLDGTAQAAQFITWNADNSAALCAKTAENNVGSHLNMSDPRITNGIINGKVANFLNRTLQHCRRRNGERKEMFGRETLYAGFFKQEAQRNHWLEFKGFRTTYDRAEWERYVKTAAALQKCIDTFFKMHAAGAVDGKLGVNNLYDVAFNGAEPTVAAYADRIVDAGAKNLCSRGGGYNANPDSIGGGYLLAELYY